MLRLARRGRCSALPAITVAAKCSAGFIAISPNTSRLITGYVSIERCDTISQEGGYPNPAKQLRAAASAKARNIYAEFMQTITGRFDDIDAMATSPLAWDQEYQQIGRGHFRGELTQLVLNSVQLARVSWSPGVLQRGAAPAGTWVFGLPTKAEGSLHVRRRPVQTGELIAATSRDDIGFAATGATDMMIVVLPTSIIETWMRLRRGIDRFDVNFPSPRWAISVEEMARRAAALHCLLEALLAVPPGVTPTTTRLIEHGISDAILDLIPSAEKLESLHNRACIARSVMEVLHDRLDDPPTLTELCQIVCARERTLFLSCVEAFGLPPARLLLEMRLNAAHRALLKPLADTTVTRAATSFGFVHFGRFSESYRRKFGELPSETLSKAKNWL